MDDLGRPCVSTGSYSGIPLKLDGAGTPVVAFIQKKNRVSVHQGQTRRNEEPIVLEENTPDVDSSHEVQVTVMGLVVNKMVRDVRASS